MSAGSVAKTQSRDADGFDLFVSQCNFSRDLYVILTTLLVPCEQKLNVVFIFISKGDILKRKRLNLPHPRLTLMNKSQCHCAARQIVDVPHVTCVVCHCTYYILMPCVCLTSSNVNN